MQNILNWFKSIIQKKTSSDSSNDFSVSKFNYPKEETKNWYLERYDIILLQRNIFAVACLISMIIIVASIIAVAYITSAKSFHPFLVQIEESTGRATVVVSNKDNLITANQSLSQYFITKYLVAREGYNQVDFSDYSRKTIRLLSASDVYRDYLGYINRNENNPQIIYGNKNSTYVKIKSWSYIDNTMKKVMVRFAVLENTGAMKTYNKIAVVDFDYISMELDELDKQINPIGFQIKGYKVSDDNS